MVNPFVLDVEKEGRGMILCHPDNINSYLFGM